MLLDTYSMSYYNWEILTLLCARDAYNSWRRPSPARDKPVSGGWAAHGAEHTEMREEMREAMMAERSAPRDDRRRPSATGSGRPADPVRTRRRGWVAGPCSVSSRAIAS